MPDDDVLDGNAVSCDPGFPTRYILGNCDMRCCHDVHGNPPKKQMMAL
jgi:hypothetical protein